MSNVHLWKILNSNISQATQSVSTNKVSNESWYHMFSILWIHFLGKPSKHSNFRPILFFYAKSQGNSRFFINITHPVQQKRFKIKKKSAALYLFQPKQFGKLPKFEKIDKKNGLRVELCLNFTIKMWILAKCLKEKLHKTSWKKSKPPGRRNLSHFFYKFRSLYIFSNFDWLIV